MSIKHIGEESASAVRNSKQNRGASISQPEFKTTDVIVNAPTISSVTNIGTTAYITASYSQNALGGIPTSFTATSSSGGFTKTVSSLSEVITITGLASNTTYTFTVSANNTVSSTASSASSSITTTIGTFSSGSNQSVADIHTLMTTMANGTTTATPTAGGTLTVNGVSLGSYDYVIKRGNQTISTFTNSDWFTNTADTRSAFIVVDGDLTINRFVRLIPSNRKLFTAIYVTGNLNLQGIISMTDRGANHSATAAGNIRLHTGTFSGVSNPQVPSSGGSGATGATRYTVGSSGAAAGTAGTAGGTGGGGAGVTYLAGGDSGPVTSGNGAAGTSFTGGSAGGSVMIYSGSGVAGNGVANGGAGGIAGPSYTYGAGGGAGNPAGLSSKSDGAQGSYGWEIGNGTAGTLVVYVKGILDGPASNLHGGKIESQGHGGWIYSYPYYMQAGGGSGGGGSVTVFYKYDKSLITPTADGGSGGSGGVGGAGTARKLAL